MNLARITALAIVTLALGAGCARPVGIPANAELIYYGPGNNVASTRPPGGGRVYLFDQSSNQVVSVILVAPDQNFRFNSLKPTHNYRVYFEPTALVTTQPAR